MTIMPTYRHVVKERERRIGQHSPTSSFTSAFTDESHATEPNQEVVVL